MSTLRDATARTMPPLRTCTSARSACTARNEMRVTRRGQPGLPRLRHRPETQMQARGPDSNFVFVRGCGSGYLRPRWRAVETHASPQLQKPGTRAPLMHAPAVRARQLCEKPWQSPAGCAPEIGSVAGYRMPPASGESCGVSLLLLLRGCELAAVSSGISSREGGASSGLRRAAISRWSSFAVRSDSSSSPARASARASLAAKESAA